MRGNNVQLIDLLTRSCFRIDFPNQLNYMMNPRYATDFRFRRILRNRRENFLNTELYQMRFNIKFCFDDSFTMAEKRLVITHGWSLLRSLHNFIMFEFERNFNDLQLRFLLFYTRSFLGLYERLIDEIPRDANLMDSIFIAGRERPQPILSRYTRYYDAIGRFQQDNVNGFINQLSTLNPSFPVRQVDEEISAFEQSHVVVSPGLSVAALNRLIDVGGENVKRILYVKWTVRLGFQLDGELFGQWLRNENLTDIENDREYVAQWRRYLGLRERGAE